ncbi:DUF2304 domain-containing protein [Nocardioides sp. Soil805]|uniref:DUF2304 domain-containing protein n=1 Tax=Nocardioides sp. Soil805 TaxID=1736416 RepID=UPI0007034603|nr:DUF2304 domain-containing protein [Nocardioides sp. Soil805]KRF36527.1 hypothetical protein ASG94_03510 [Nocardioides sp. Soil805]
MNASAVLGIVGSATILLALFEMMRRHRLREKYALIWAVVAVFVLLVAAFPLLLQSVAHALGIQVPANLLFFAASILIMVLTLQHSSELGRLEERTRTLAEEIALLRLRIEQPQGLAPSSSTTQQPDDEHQDGDG